MADLERIREILATPELAEAARELREMLEAGELKKAIDYLIELLGKPEVRALVSDILRGVFIRPVMVIREARELLERIRGHPELWERLRELIGD